MVIERMRGKPSRHLVRERIAVDRERAAGRQLVVIAGGENERAGAAHFLVQEADGVGLPVVGAERVRADELGKAIGLVRFGRAQRAASRAARPARRRTRSGARRRAGGTARDAPTAGHRSPQDDGFAELVCSNSFDPMIENNAVGCLHEEMRRAGSLIISGNAQSRDAFSANITHLSANPLVTMRTCTGRMPPDDWNNVIVSDGR